MLSFIYLTAKRNVLQSRVCSCRAPTGSVFGELVCFFAYSPFFHNLVPQVRFFKLLTDLNLKFYRCAAKFLRSKNFWMRFWFHRKLTFLFTNASFSLSNKSPLNEFTCSSTNLFFLWWRWRYKFICSALSYSFVLWMDIVWSSITQKCLHSVY